MTKNHSICRKKVLLPFGDEFMERLHTSDQELRGDAFRQVYIVLSFKALN